MSRLTIRITENHIFCDICNKDSGDVLGYSCVQMKEIIEYLKDYGWKITAKISLCDKHNNAVMRSN